MINRTLSPGEFPSPRKGAQQERAFLNRIHTAQIESIDSVNGTIDVNILGLGVKYTVEIPLGGMSVNRTASSWFRYMPQQNDIALIIFDQTNVPKCIGYGLQGNDATAVESATQNTGKFVPRLGGYKSLARAKTASDGGSSEDDSSVLSLAPGATLESCVLQILCGLSQAALTALSVFLQGQLGIVEAAILAAEAKLLQYNVLLAGLEFAAKAAEQFLAQVRADANIVPLSLISGCLTLGNLNIAVNAILDSATAELESFVNDVSRLLSLVDEQNFVLAQLRQTEQLYNAIIAGIQTCSGTHFNTVT